MTDVPELVIRALDPTSDADMDGFQDVYAAAELAEDPHASLYSREDGVALLTVTDTATLFDGFGAFLGDRMVGETVLMGGRRDNLDVGRICSGWTRRTVASPSAPLCWTTSRSTRAPRGNDACCALKRGSARVSMRIGSSPSGTATPSR